MKYGYLLHDPYPEWRDTRIWQRLLRKITEYNSGEKAFDLQIKLYHFRAYGAIIKPTGKGLKICYQPDSVWDSEEEFKQMALSTFADYSHELMILFTAVRGEINGERKKELARLI